MTTTTIAIAPDRLAKLRTITLLHGGHKTPDDGLCAMEAAAWLAGEPHSDHPACACPVVAAAVRRLNDSMPEELRTKLLRPLLPKIVGSKASAAVRQKRAYIAADFAVRVFAPIMLDARGRKEDAAKLRAAAKIRDKSSAVAGRQLCADANAAAAAAAAANAAAYASAKARRRVWLLAVRMVRAMLAVQA